MLNLDTIPFYSLSFKLEGVYISYDWEKTNHIFNYISVWFRSFLAERHFFQKC